MATKILFFVLLLVCSFSMRIHENDPQRNKTIVKVLAAYCNIGIKSSTDGYIYDDSLSFSQVVTEFIKVYLAQQVASNSYGQLSILYAHKDNMKQLKDKVLNNKNHIMTLQLQTKIASEIVEQLDAFYYKVYGIQTDSPDKYIGLINVNKIEMYPLDPAFDSMRKIFGVPAVQDLPYTYQYFHAKSKKYTSQYDQDGVIEAIFQLIGTWKKFFVEIGGGNGYDNTGYLRNTKGWNGLLFNSGYYFEDKDPNAKITMEKVTPEKAVEIFQKYEVPKQLDFLSVDIDGNDYWVTKALLQYYKPAVISMEINPNFPAAVSTTITANQPQFTWKYDKIFGVSARAIYELGKQHGYSYVYHMIFTDIFLVRDDLLPAKFRGMKLEDTFDAYPIHKLNLNMKKFEVLNRSLLISRAQNTAADSSIQFEQKVSKNKSELVQQRVKELTLQLNESQATTLMLEIVVTAAILLLIGKYIYSKLVNKRQKNQKQYKTQSSQISQSNRTQLA